MFSKLIPITFKLPVLVKDKLAVTAPTVDELTQVNVDVHLLGGDEAELIGS